MALYLLLGRLAAKLLYDTPVGDPRILIAATLPLLATAFVMCYFQARRLGNVDPASALRNDA
jgi:hypothetical protein